MTDHGNGTYSFSYSVMKSGKVSVLVYLEDAPGVYVEYFANQFWIGNIAKTETLYNIDKDWGSGEIIPGKINNVSANLYTKLRAPVTGSYTFTLISDDGSDLKLDGTLQINRLTAG